MSIKDHVHFLSPSDLDRIRLILQVDAYVVQIGRFHYSPFIFKKRVVKEMHVGYYRRQNGINNMYILIL